MKVVSKVCQAVIAKTTDLSTLQVASEASGHLPPRAQRHGLEFWMETMVTSEATMTINITVLQYAA